MIPIRWIEKRTPHWQRLEQLIQRGAKGLHGIDGRELQELGTLYRQTASDLSVVLEDQSSRNLAVYLNQLLGRSHNLLYLGHRFKVSRIASFYSEMYPRLFRETLAATSLATGLFFVSMLAAWAITLHDAGFAATMLGPHMMDTIDRRQMWTESVVAVKPFAASAITTNNLTVAFSMFALGITGIGTLWMILFNGLLLGAVGAATWHAGMALSLWSFVAPHGVLELPAIFIAGGSGIELARGLFFPGFLPRRDSLAQSAGRASRLLLGTAPLLLLAGTIEGFISPTAIPMGLKFLLAGLLFPALVLWLFSSYKRPRSFTSR
ncbi:MAG: stage II sporulation protein M [Acidobacteriaceae bacterium]|nr:stage II sporulation protein M [Acidobacteriaceae bacterium]